MRRSQNTATCIYNSPPDVYSYIRGVCKRYGGDRFMLNSPGMRPRISTEKGLQNTTPDELASPRKAAHVNYQRVWQAEWRVLAIWPQKVWVQELQVGNKPRRSRRLAMTSAEAGYIVHVKSNLLHFPLMTGMRVCYKVLSVQLVQDMHVIPRCWDTNDFRRSCDPPISSQTNSP